MGPNILINKTLIQTSHLKLFQHIKCFMGNGDLFTLSPYFLTTFTTNLQLSRHRQLSCCTYMHVSNHVLVF